MVWKKVTNTSKQVRFEREEGSDFISVTFDGAKWNVWSGDTFDEGGEQLNKEPFKNKTQALRFANNWMKSHPNG